MFILFGTRTLKTSHGQGLNYTRNCDRCHYLSRMQEYKSREYFTLFFMPVFPISKGESLLVCNRCGASFYPQAEDCARSDQGTGDTRWNTSPQEEKIVIECEHCKGRLRVPVKPGRKRTVTCSHCREEFDLKVDKCT